jgi:hypothetical protein
MFGKEREETRSNVYLSVKDELLVPGGASSMVKASDETS